MRPSWSATVFKGKNINEMGGGMGQSVSINSHSWICIFGTEYGAEIWKALLPRLAQQNSVWAKTQNFCSGTAKIGGW